MKPAQCCIKLEFHLTYNITSSIEMGKYSKQITRKFKTANLRSGLYITMQKSVYRGADNSSAQPRRKQAQKHVKDTRDFNNIETRTVIKYFLQGKAPTKIHAILTETLACFLPGRPKDLSAPL